MALTKDRGTPRRDGVQFEHPVAADTVIYAGALVVLDAGYALPGETGTSLVAVGVAEANADNTGGADGDVTVTVRRGVFRFENSAAADAITRAEIGKVCYVVDDETVAKTDGSKTRSVAGVISDVDDDGVWVDLTTETAAVAAFASGLDELGATVEGLDETVTTQGEAIVDNAAAIATGAYSNPATIDARLTTLEGV